MDTRARGVQSITLHPTKHFSRYAAVYFDLLGEFCIFCHLYCKLFSFSSKVTFGEIKNKAKFATVTGVNSNGSIYQNDLLYKILSRLGWLMF